MKSPKVKFWVVMAMLIINFLAVVVAIYYFMTLPHGCLANPIHYYESLENTTCFCTNFLQIPG